jgi:xanthine dehydrogenase accessory factor
MTTEQSALISPIVLIRGAGEMASAIAWRLYMANIKRICMTELDAPLCVRRLVSFCAALDGGGAAVEGVEALAAHDLESIALAWRRGRIAVVPQSRWSRIGKLRPDVVIDAILAKRNIATSYDDAKLVIALGPGFTAGHDCHFVIETNRGHNLGRIISEGSAAPNTGVPGDIAGHTLARVFRSNASGTFQASRSIGDTVVAGDCIGTVDGIPVIATISGLLRGLVRSGTLAPAGLKLGDIDPRSEPGHCPTISDKARAIAGAALEAVMRHYNSEQNDARTKNPNWKDLPVRSSPMAD